MGSQKTVGKTLPPKTGPKTPFTADAAASQIARQRLGSLAADHEGEGITAMKMMSLFDGSGGFPLAAAICGIEPVYASEVEPYPIAVTRSRFPKMIHIGDVSKVHGWELEPVDVITFGSPCQDMSIAGKRAGIKNTAAGDEETTRSGLFLEAVRIIREMREATNGRYPAFAVWENVPGAFSSNKGEDFRIVLQELVWIVEPEAVVPEVPKGGWNYFDLWMGDKWSLAYRTVDAQHWGVPQRRRRIYLVLDLRGGRAGKVLFEPESLRGYPAPRREERKGTSANAERYIVRRLTPTECARLQGFPDWWGHPDQKEDFTEDEYRFWLQVRNTHAVINDRSKKQYTKEQMLSWYNKLHTDSSEYKMWGNGIALPNALYVMIGIRKELEKDR